MFGFAGSAATAPIATPQEPDAVPPQVAIAPAPNQAPIVPQGQTDPFKPSPLDVLVGVLAGQGTFHDVARGLRMQAIGDFNARQRVEQAASEARQNPAMQDLYNATYGAWAGTPGAAPLAARYAPFTLKPGETRVNMPGGGSSFAPVILTDDTSGDIQAVTDPNAPAKLLGHNGGGYKAEAGLFYSPRDGVAGTYRLPQILPPGTSPGTFTPNVSASAGVAALNRIAALSGVSHTTSAAAPLQLDGPAVQAVGASPPGPGAPSGAAAAAPRGIRNNNFGNLQALPRGQMWDGQTGVDPAGYAVFATPEAGMKAAQTNLNTYATKHGINTVAGVISRWAPQGAAGNNTGNYISFVANQLGVKPDQPLDMSNPQVQQGILGGIFQFENGPKAMAAWQSQPVGAPGGAGPPAAQPALSLRSSLPSSGANGADAGSASAGWSVGPPVGQPRPMTADERAKWRISPEDRTPYMMGADGIPKAVGDDVFGPKQQLEYTAQVTGMEPYKNYTLSRGFLGTMQSLMKQPGGFADLSLIENAGKTINPTVAIRPNMIDQYGKEVGWPDWLVGEVSGVVNHGGHLTQEGRNALLNIAQANVKSHWDQLQPILKKVDYDAKRFSTSREALIPDLVPMPGEPAEPYAGSGIPGRPVAGKPPGFSPPPPPQQGEVRGGYRFIGGDPANPKSWARAGGN